MDYKSMVEMAKKNSIELTPYEKTALSSRDAVRNIDGEIRWLDDNQIVEFVAPPNIRTNVEFSIKNRPGQKIWFSQLSDFAMNNNLSTPLLDEIQFKGEDCCPITNKFSSAFEFWNAVKNKSFRVKVLGTGIIPNKKSSVVQELRSEAISKRRTLSEEDIVKFVLERIRDAVNNGNSSKINGTLNNKKVYRLTEI